MNQAEQMREMCANLVLSLDDKMYSNLSLAIAIRALLLPEVAEKNVITGEFKKYYAVEQIIKEALILTIHQFDGQCSVVSVIGILEMIKADLINGATK